MIGALRGRLLKKNPPFLLLEVGGVGYELEAPMTTFYDLPDDDREITLSVHMVVRDDAQLLYGFSDSQQRELFRMLIKINGVGPRVALGVLSAMRARQLVECVQNQDADMLARVPGIGKKTAARILMDMQDRVNNLSVAGDAPTPAAGDARADAVQALLSLGYKIADANKAVAAVRDADLPREELIRRALQYLSK